MLDSVPVIDLLQDDAAIVAQLDEALRLFGFFYVSNHGIDESLVREQFQIARQIFALPSEVKLAMPFDKELDIGYIGTGGQAVGKLNDTDEREEKKDTREQFIMSSNKLISSIHTKGIQVDPHNVLAGSQNYHIPQVPDHTRIMNDYLTAAYALNQSLQHYLFQALRVSPDRRAALGAHPFLVLKQMTYQGPPSDPANGRFGVGPHTDWGSFTLLATDATPGLEIYDTLRDRWLSVPPRPNTLIINAGDQIEVLTGGYYKSALHRVVTLTDQPRYSTAVFMYFGMPSSFACLEQFQKKDKKDAAAERTITYEHFRHRMQLSVGD